jgi:hypothetical protein
MLIPVLIHYAEVHIIDAAVDLSLPLFDATLCGRDIKFSHVGLLLTIGSLDDIMNKVARCGPDDTIRWRLLPFQGRQRVFLPPFNSLKGGGAYDCTCYQWLHTFAFCALIIALVGLLTRK